MTTTIKKQERLRQFRDREDFKIDSYFNTDDNILLSKVRGLFTKLINELLAFLETSTDVKALKLILKKGLDEFSHKVVSDTEDREATSDIFSEIAQIVEVKFVDDLTIWLYGSILGSAMVLKAKMQGAEKIQRIVYDNCFGCNTQLQTFVLEDKLGIPSSNWFIVKCNNCETLNLIESAENAKVKRPGNYTIVESLFKINTSREEALIRLEQIENFR